MTRPNSLFGVRTPIAGLAILIALTTALTARQAPASLAIKLRSNKKSCQRYDGCRTCAQSEPANNRAVHAEQDGIATVDFIRTQQQQSDFIDKQKG